MISRFKFLKIFFVLIAISSVYLAVNLRWGGDEKWMRIVQTDGRGYYGHLPAIFIYNLSYDFSYKIENEKVFPKEYYVRHQDDYSFNKYYLGTAIMQSPFFLMAHFTSYLADKPMDGYSKLYFKFINLATIFYLVIGLWFMAKFMSLYRIKELYIIISLAAIFFGTNLFFYSIYESSMSHVYSFSLFSAFAYYAHLFFYRFRKRYIVYLGAIVGLIIIVRPINAVILLSLPFFAGRWDVLKLGFEKIRVNPLALSLGLFAGFFFIFLQLLEYKIGTDHWYIYTYTTEGGFDWSGKNIINFLFSYKKGAFLYTPMFLVAILLSIYSFKENKFRFIAWISFIFIAIYVLSAWTQWWYGGSFSSRVMVDFLPFFALPIGFGIQSIKTPWKKITIISLVALVIVLCLIQTYQYHTAIFHYVDMDKDWYWRVFLKF